jgi:SAM-dependent methyltransferase
MISLKTIERAVLAPNYESQTYVEEYLKFHMERFLETTCLLQKVVNHNTNLIDVGTYGSLVPVLRDILGIENITCTAPCEKNFPKSEITTLANAINGDKYSFNLDRFDIEQRFPYDNEIFDVVVFTEVFEHLTLDPMHTLSEINRITKTDGWLVFSTPNCASTFSIIKILKGQNPYTFPIFTKEPSRDRHNREYVSEEIKEVLKAAGYEIVIFKTKNIYNTNKKKKTIAISLLNSLLWLGSILSFKLIEASDRGESIFALAKKTSDVVDRYPSFLYI